MSRPTDYTDELAEKICELIMVGTSLRSICADESMPDRSSIYRWLTANSGFATKYAHARARQADYLFDEMAEIEDETQNQRLDPAAARAILGSKQWRAAKLAPKKYGDFQRTEISGADGGPMQVAAVDWRVVDAPKP